MQWRISDENPITGRVCGQWKIGKILSNGVAKYALTHPMLTDRHGLKIIWCDTAQEAMHKAGQIQANGFRVES